VRERERFLNDVERRHTKAKKSQRKKGRAA
jgi:hypothetical protein